MPCNYNTTIPHGVVVVYSGSIMRLLRNLAWTGAFFATTGEGECLNILMYLSHKLMLQ